MPPALPPKQAGILGDLCFSFSKSLLSPGLALNEIICKICFPAIGGLHIVSPAAAWS